MDRESQSLIRTEPFEGFPRTELENAWADSPIDSIMANTVQRKIRNLVRDQFWSFKPDVILSYATAHRRNLDAECAGPGLIVAEEVITYLFDNGCPCYCDLMTPPGEKWPRYMMRVETSKVMVVLMSQSFFQSVHCLQEVAAAIENNVNIIPVRVDETSESGEDISRDVESMWKDEELGKYAKGKKNSRKVYRDLELKRCMCRMELKDLSSLPARGTILSDKNALEELVVRVKEVLGEDNRSVGSEGSISTASYAPRRRSDRSNSTATYAPRRSRAISSVLDTAPGPPGIHHSPSFTLIEMAEYLGDMECSYLKINAGRAPDGVFAGRSDESHGCISPCGNTWPAAIAACLNQSIESSDQNQLNCAYRAPLRDFFNHFSWQIMVEAFLSEACFERPDSKERARKWLANISFKTDVMMVNCRLHELPLAMVPWLYLIVQHSNTRDQLELRTIVEDLHNYKLCQLKDGNLFFSYESHESVKPPSLSSFDVLGVGSARLSNSLSKGTIDDNGNPRDLYGNDYVKILGLVQTKDGHVFEGACSFWSRSAAIRSREPDVFYITDKDGAGKWYAVKIKQEDGVIFTRDSHQTAISRIVTGSATSKFLAVKPGVAKQLPPFYEGCREGLPGLFASGITVKNRPVLLGVSPMTQRGVQRRKLAVATFESIPCYDSRDEASYDFLCDRLKHGSLTSRFWECGLYLFFPALLVAATSTIQPRCLFEANTRRALSFIWLHFLAELCSKIWLLIESGALTAWPEFYSEKEKDKYILVAKILAQPAVVISFTDTALGRAWGVWHRRWPLRLHILAAIASTAWVLFLRFTEADMIWMIAVLAAIGKPISEDLSGLQFSGGEFCSFLGSAAVAECVAFLAAFVRGHQLDSQWDFSMLLVAIFWVGVTVVTLMDARSKVERALEEEQEVVTVLKGKDNEFSRLREHIKERDTSWGLGGVANHERLAGCVAMFLEKKPSVGAYGVLAIKENKPGLLPLRNYVHGSPKGALVKAVLLGDGCHYQAYMRNECFGKLAEKKKGKVRILTHREVGVLSASTFPVTSSTRAAARHKREGRMVGVLIQGRTVPLFGFPVPSANEL